MKLDGKVAIVTGAASGIGQASAELFAKHGAQVVVADLQVEKGEEVARKIRDQGGSAVFQRTDVAEVQDIKDMVARAVNKWGRVDVLYNNAGIAQPIRPIEEVSEDLFDRVMRINVRSVFLGSKYVVPVMKQQGGGSIINTASIAAVKPRLGHNGYAASKGAVITLTKSLASELASYKIRVNCINPVAVDTPMAPEFQPDVDVNAAKESYKQTIPLGRMASPLDIARGALYLASDDAELVTGIELNIDGGRAL
ncbi:SDR family oxidoreductase [Alicyclobacillus tolerans]|uniref:SDR family oxidoreductase n=1 Tax=Alicyclobacillus tolerans TaxID=90970 RepID=UPI001F2D663B|nr:SDR family oxidoreductase [Alicyclobacillus tolerans]MCF8565760.1 SDR family oxidoreductase [Alicyclobacillus tolerans]